jgi:hypothetical protein
MAFLAYNIFHAFIGLNLKPQLRDSKPEKYWACLIAAELYSGAGTTPKRAPDLPPYPIGQTLPDAALQTFLAQGLLVPAAIRVSAPPSAPPKCSPEHALSVRLPPIPFDTIAWLHPQPWRAESLPTAGVARRTLW